MSLIGNHDAYTSWSPTVVLPTQTYDNSQQTPYVAPQAPIVVTNPTTNEGTVLDSDFIEQIVRRNQENIYDSSKAQKIAILTDENDIAYAKQIDTDLLKNKTRYVTSDNENETHFTQNLKVDELLVRANGGDYKNLWDEIVNHSAHIYAGVQRDDNQDVIITANTTNIATNTTNIATNTTNIATHTTNIANNSSDIAGLATALNSNFDDITANTTLLTNISSQLNAVRDDVDLNIMPDIGNNIGGIDALRDDIDNVILPHLADHTTQIADLESNVNGVILPQLDTFTATFASQASSINHINVVQTAMDANIYNQISTQVANRTLASDGTVLRESIDARFNLYGLDTELDVRGEFFGDETAGAQNVKGHIRKTVFYNKDGSSILHNDITFVIRDGDDWKMTRYYWNPSSQTVYLGVGRHGGDTLPEMRFVPDALNNVMPIGDITNTDDLTAEVIHSNFWTHPNVNNIGNGYIVQNNAFTYHMRNLVYTPTTERIALKSVQDSILTTIEKITNPPAPYYNHDWFAIESVAVNSVELRLPENSLIFAGSLYRTREFENPQTKLIPYLDNQGRLNSGLLWEEEFSNQTYGAHNGEKYPNQYVAGLVPAMPIADVESNLRYEYFLNGEGHWTRNYTNQLNTISNTFTQILNRMEDQITGLVAVNSSGRTTSGGLVTFGGDAAITGSPAAIGYINELGRLNTARLFDQIFNDQVFGVEDPDTVSSRRKSNAYLAGLVPTAENVTDRTTKYLRADGTWSLVPIITDYLTTAEVDAKISAIPAPDLSSYDTSAQVDAKISAIPAPVADPKLADFDRNVYDVGANLFMWDLQRLGYIAMPESHFTGNIFWKPTGQGLTNLNVMNDRVNTLITDVETIKSDYQTSAQVDAKISAIPLPDLSSYDTSAQVDAKISAIPAPVADPKLADFDRNIYDVGANLFMWDLQRINYIAMPDTHFHNQIFWKPTGQGLTNLNVMNDRVNTLITDINALPDFDTITSANKFCITNTANGGTISYVTPTTSDINEGTNLYYTDDRVASKITTALQGGEIANIITNQLQAQTLIANSDIRLKKNIVRLKEDNIISTLEPVKYVFKTDSSKRTRYGFIAQDVEDKLPELVHTNCDSIKGINYQDIIALLVKDNQELRSVCEELEKRLSLLEMKN